MDETEDMATPKRGQIFFFRLPVGDKLWPTFTQSTPSSAAVYIARGE